MDTQPSSTEVSSSGEGKRDPEPSSALPTSSGKGTALLALALAGILVGAGAIALVMARTPRANAAVATATVPPPATAPVPRGAPGSPRELPARSPKWSGGVEHVGRRTRVVFFELAAENEITMWTRRVRPVLSVRCVGESTEAYVLTEAAAAIEGNGETNTVSLAFDDAAPQKQTWFPSDDYQALFSPDAIALSRQIAGARTLRFGFTPYNAAPAVAQFDLRGFDAHIGEIAKSCRWKS
jgi:hypothetical protein